MKGIPIKFRIVDVDGDCKFVELSRFEALGYGAKVSQLVGYDAEGNEVYEGDKVKVGDEIVKVEWCNECTCFAVKWKNGTSDSYGTVFYHYNDKPYLVKENE